MSASFTTHPRLLYILLLASCLLQQPNISGVRVCAPTICGAPCFAAPRSLPDNQHLTSGLPRRPLPQACQQLENQDLPRRANAGCAPSARQQQNTRKLPTPAYLRRPPRIRCPRSLKSPRYERKSTRTASLPPLPSTPAHALLPLRLDMRPSSSRTLAYASPWNTATTRSVLALPRHTCRCLPTPDLWDRNARFNPSGIRTACYDAGPPRSLSPRCSPEPPPHRRRLEWSSTLTPSVINGFPSPFLKGAAGQTRPRSPSRGSRTSPQAWTPRDRLDRKRPRSDSSGLFRSARDPQPWNHPPRDNDRLLRGTAPAPDQTGEHSRRPPTIARSQENSCPHDSMPRARLPRQPCSRASHARATRRAHNGPSPAQCRPRSGRGPPACPNSSP
jgi:hypothetical protein